MTDTKPIIVGPTDSSTDQVPIVAQVSSNPKSRNQVPGNKPVENEPTACEVDPLPWLICNLRQKQQNQRLHDAQALHESQTLREAHTADVGNLG